MQPSRLGTIVFEKGLSQAMAHNKIIHLGEIKWFGGYNGKRDCYNKCGVLVGEFFFRASSFDSPNKERYIQVQLKNQPAFFSFVREDNTEAGISWVKLIIEMTDEELKSLYRQNDSVKEILNSPSQFLSLLNFSPIGSLFGEIINNIGFHSLMAGIRDNSGLPSYVHSFIIHNIPWADMTEDDVAEGFLLLRESQYEKVEILKGAYPAWIDDTKVLEKLRTGYFPECISVAIENKDYPTIYKLFKNVSDWNVKKTIADYLPADLFLSDSDFCKMLSEQRIIEIIRNYVNEDNIDNIEKIAALLSVIEPTVYPRSAIELGDQFLKCNLPLIVWQQLNNAEKVWFVLFLSLHLDNLPIWKEPFGDIYVYEHRMTDTKNNSVLTAIEFLTIALVDEKKKQDIFNKGHKYLEDAIIQDFETNGCPSKELMQLICRCKSDDSLVCAARYWKTKNTAWCSTNREPCGMFKKDEGEGIDYHKTGYIYSQRYQADTALCRLSMADLLSRVGYSPDLDAVYNSVFKYTWGFEEYPYRISGRIVQLNRLFSHMHCRCGKTMKSNYAYSVKIDARMSITHAYCPEAVTEGNEKHDPDVYLNECWNCDEVIDSRESHFKQGNDRRYYPVSRTDINGYYVCMSCGAGTLNVQPAVCPKCGCVDRKLLEFRDLYKDGSKLKFEKCNKCGYTSRSWRSQFELFDRQKGSDNTAEGSYCIDNDASFTVVDTDELPF